MMVGLRCRAASVGSAAAPPYRFQFASNSPGETFRHQPGCVNSTQDCVKLTHPGNHHQSFTAKIRMARLVLMVGLA